jgi:hypothetical protein
VDRLGEFVVPYQHALETEAGQRPLHLYLPHKGRLFGNSKYYGHLCVP